MGQYSTPLERFFVHKSILELETAVGSGKFVRGVVASASNSQIAFLRTHQPGTGAPGAIMTEWSAGQNAYVGEYKIYAMSDERFSPYVDEFFQLYFGKMSFSAESIANGVDPELWSTYGNALGADAANVAYVARVKNALVGAVPPQS